ncbi:MAG: hydantoinase/oxoprolinase N-terminal domain-containing protein, partial [Pseudomonadales bacterium]
MNASAARVAVDIGGTFTDVVLLQGARQFSAKVLTTYADPADAVMEGLERVTSAAAIAPG